MNWLLFRIRYIWGAEALAKKRYGDAESHFARALDSKPGNVEALMGMAESEWRLGKQEEARKRVEVILEKEPGFSGARFLASRFDLESNKFEQARQQLMHAVEGDPRFLEAWYELGKVSIALGDEEVALKAFGVLAGSDPLVLPYRLAELEEKLGSKGTT